ncbi:MAG: N-acyl amino acid synthase FeeM domain-containing protein [Rubripirellula sp.]
MKPVKNTRLISGRLSVPSDEWSKIPRTVWDDLEFRLAKTRLELYSSFRLLQERYTAAGLSTDQQPIRVEPFHFWRQSQVFVAIRNGRIVGCLTLVRPGPFGMPSEHSHPEMLGAVPLGSAVGEVTSFAIANNCGPHSLDIFLGLTQLVQRFGIHNHVEVIFAVVHPRHARFYERAIGFKVIGEELPCERVKGSPGLALMVKLDANDACRSQWQECYDLKEVRDDDADLRPRSMTESHKRFFSQYLPLDARPTTHDVPPRRAHQQSQLLYNFQIQSLSDHTSNTDRTS